jgi:FkbM family methyltransferase
VPQEPPFISYAQNREDVVLWRALRHQPTGRYVEVGANHPTEDSVSRAFYDRGWSGLTVEPVPYFADLHRAERPRDTLVQAAVTERGEGDVVLHVVPGTGLSTTVDAVSERHDAAGIEHTDLTVPAVRLDDALRQHGWTSDRDIHFLLVDVEGAEREVLRSIDLRTWRPWILVIEATEPNSTTSTHDEWEPDLLAAGYEFCLFDGLSRYYVSSERAAELGPSLSYPACVLDRYQSLAHATALETANELLHQATYWRTTALRGWGDALGGQLDQLRRSQAEERLEARVRHLEDELAAMHRTLSWRVTRPLRTIRTLPDIVRPR